jgi:hypothetical protein
MEKQEDVKQEAPKVDGAADSSPAEEVTTTDAPPVVEEQAEATETPVVESNDEKLEDKPQVSKEVPYERFKEVYDELKLYKEATPQTSTDGTPALDQESSAAVQAIVNQQLERQKSLDFVRRHGEELKDPLLAAAYRNEAETMMAKGEYVDYESALSNAQKLLDVRLKTTLSQAKSEGVEEGKQSVQSKLEATSAGESVRTEEIPVDQLSSEEFAKKMGLKRV